MCIYGRLPYIFERSGSAENLQFDRVTIYVTWMGQPCDYNIFSSLVRSSVTRVTTRNFGRVS